MVGMMLAAVVGVRFASADPIDADQDGYPANPYNPARRDCNDQNAGVSPRAQEVIGDDVDQDCDGYDALRRSFVLDAFITSHWNLEGADVSEDGDELSVGSGGRATLAVSIGDTRGPVHVALQVTDMNASNPCTLRVRTNDSLGNHDDVRSILGEGRQILSFADLPDPERMITQMRFQCPTGGRLGLDWLTVQNSAQFALAPTKDSIFGWRDLNAPGAGQYAGVVRTVPGIVYLDGIPWGVDSRAVLLATSDEGGIGMKDLDAGTPWRSINGTGPDGISELMAWDVAGVDWVEPEGVLELFALTAETRSSETVGGLWYSSDEGETWSQIADTFHDGVGLDGRHGACTDLLFGSGSFILAERESEDLWVASNVSHRYYDLDDRYDTASEEFESGVYLFDQTEGLCPEPIDTLPDDMYIGAIARTYSRGATAAVGWAPLLLVGYTTQDARKSASEPSIYVCSLPEDSSSSGVVDAGCGADLVYDAIAGTGVRCDPVQGSEGLSIVDFEVDPLDPSIVYVADTGVTWTQNTEPDLERECDGTDGGGVLLLNLDAAPWTVGDVWSLTSIQPGDWTGLQFGVTGVSVDPEGDYLFAALPGDDNANSPTPLWRVPTADVLLAEPDWERVLGPDDGSDFDYGQLLHRVNMEYSNSWFDPDNNEIATPYPFAELFGPSQPFDVNWYYDPDSETFRSVVTTRGDMWAVDGLTSSVGGNIGTSWTYWPEVERYEDRDWGTLTASDLALDMEGNLWATVKDPVFWMVPDAGSDDYPVERDCLAEGFGAGGSSVDVASYDGSIWLTLYDQAATEGEWESSMAVARVVHDPDDTWGGAADGELWEWTFQGAGATLDTNFRSLENQVMCRQYRVEGDPRADYQAPDAHVAEPVGDPCLGCMFSDYDPLSPVPNPDDQPWGHPWVVRALDQNVAIVAFRSYVDAEDLNNQRTPIAGALAYTLDGGSTWTDVPVEGYSGTVDCGGGDPDQATDVLSWVETLTLIGEGVDSYVVYDTNDELVDWSFDLVLGASENSNPEQEDAVTRDCNVARVRITPTVTDWEWIPLPTDASATCRVTPSQFLGAVANPHRSNEVFIWGSYELTAAKADATHTLYEEWGGVCLLDLETGSATPVVSPETGNATYELAYTSVAPHPEDATRVLIGTCLDTGTLVSCIKPEIDAANGYIEWGTGGPPVPRCPSYAPPLLADRQSDGSWTVTALDTAPAGVCGYTVAWGTDGTEHERFYYSGHGGSWSASVAP